MITIDSIKTYTKMMRVKTKEVEAGEAETEGVIVVRAVMREASMVGRAVVVIAEAEGVKLMKAVVMKPVMKAIIIINNTSSAG
jgi:hypothetical protein